MIELPEPDFDGGRSEDAPIRPCWCEAKVREYARSYAQAAVLAERAAERERCARIVESLVIRSNYNPRKEIATAIRNQSPSGSSKDERNED